MLVFVITACTDQADIDALAARLATKKQQLEIVDSARNEQHMKCHAYQGWYESHSQELATWRRQKAEWQARGLEGSVTTIYFEDFRGFEWSSNEIDEAFASKQDAIDRNYEIGDGAVNDWITQEWLFNSLHVEYLDVCLALFDAGQECERYETIGASHREKGETIVFPDCP